MCLINISRPLQEPSMELSLMINGNRVNRRCGICKWRYVWCAARSPARYHKGGLLTSWIRQRGRWIWKGLLRGCASASGTLHWELALQLMHADVPSKGDCEISHRAMLRYRRRECEACAWNSEILGPTFWSFVVAFRKISRLALEAELSKYLSKGNVD